MSESPADVERFLARHPPFDALEPEALAEVASSVECRRYGVRETVLVEDGPPASSFFVIREGSMELLHEDEVVDVLEPGESFGHPSLLTGLAPSFTVRAHEPALCYLVGREQALRVLGRPAGAGFVAATLRERLTRTGHVVHALPERLTQRVASLVDRPPLFCEPRTTIREAARRMTDAGTSAVLVRREGEVGIVTDADLRSKVLAAGLPADSPIDQVASYPVLAAPPQQLAVEAMTDMLAQRTDHVAIVDARGVVLGVLSAAELMSVEGTSPFALRRAIAGAAGEDALVDAARRLPRAFVSLLATGVGPADVGRVLALASDDVTMRLIDFAFERHGPAPVPWAWLALGSVARRELTLASDQDNALAYADPGGPEVDDYFARVAADVNGGLERCGFGYDNAEVLARDRRWRMTESEWLRVLGDTLVSPDRSNLVRASVSFDFRHVGGGLVIVPPLVGLLRSAPAYPDFLRRLARTATDYRPPLGFRGAIRREGGGGGRVDVKRGGILPIANLARFHALASGVTISATLDRLVAAEELGRLDPETAQALRESFELVQRVRLEHHAEQIAAGLAIDNLVDPGGLPPLERIELREAFRAIAHAQKQLAVYLPLGL